MIEHDAGHVPEPGAAPKPETAGESSPARLTLVPVPLNTRRGFRGQCYAAQAQLQRMFQQAAAKPQPGDDR